jgi:hypothetical protein
MAELNYAHQDLFSDPAALSDSLLDESSLNTVLDMLAAITSAEELALLKTLTIAQKHQVWDATSEPVKARLRQIKASAHTAISSGSEVEEDEIDYSSEDPVELDSSDYSEELPSEEFGQFTIAPDGSGVDHRLQSFPSLSDQLVPVAGDWIVLEAKPKLTTAELIAIWEVVEVQGVQARIKAKGLGMRNYPVSWMRVYPKLSEQPD